MMNVHSKINPKKYDNVINKVIINFICKKKALKCLRAVLIKFKMGTKYEKISIIIEKEEYGIDNRFS